MAWKENYAWQWKNDAAVADVSFHRHGDVRQKTKEAASSRSSWGEDVNARDGAAVAAWHDASRSSTRDRDWQRDETWNSKQAWHPWHEVKNTQTAADAQWSKEEREARWQGWSSWRENAATNNADVASAQQEQSEQSQPQLDDRTGDQSSFQASEEQSQSSASDNYWRGQQGCDHEEDEEVGRECDATSAAVAAESSIPEAAATTSAQAPREELPVKAPPSTKAPPPTLLDDAPPPPATAAPPQQEQENPPPPPARIAPQRLPTKPAPPLPPVSDSQRSLPLTHHPPSLPLTIPPSSLPTAGADEPWHTADQWQCPDPWYRANAPPPSQPPLVEGGLSQQTPQSRRSADDVTAPQPQEQPSSASAQRSNPIAEPRAPPERRELQLADGGTLPYTRTVIEVPQRPPPGIADNDWNRTLDRIKAAKVFDARFYKGLFAETRPHDMFKQHNAAAKWFRHFCVQGGHTRITLETSSAVAVKKVFHTLGTSYKFLMDVDAHWIWHEMIGHLTDKSIDKVCSAPLVSCDFQLRGETDKGPTGERVWDFRVHRADGTMMSLHPDWTRRKFKAIEFGAETYTLAAAPSHSKDVKRCKAYRGSLGSEDLRFDPKKDPH